VIGVVHLVWGPLGPDPLREFVSSYRTHRAGADHELIILLNDVAPAQRPQLQHELEDVPHRLVDLGTAGQDLAAYARALMLLDHDRICFLNSYATVLGDDWLAKLDSALDAPRAGIVGPTGSWMSLRSFQLHIHRLPSHYRGVLPEPKLTLTQFAALELDGAISRNARASNSVERTHARWRSVFTVLRSLPSAAEQVAQFSGFPTMHIRTSAFMGERKLLSQLDLGKAANKISAYRLESGRLSLTRKIQERGLYPLVVDRDGRVYEASEWPRSNTFWQAKQERLLVGDKQTRLYATGDLSRRRLLSALAWGRQAEPAP
jgi:hypothetical protein